MRPTTRRFLLAVLCTATPFLGCSLGDDPGAPKPVPRDAAFGYAFPTAPQPLSSCPEGTSQQIMGTPGIDVLDSTKEGTCIVADASADMIRVLAGADRNSVMAGDGNDFVDVHEGASLTTAMLGEGIDRFVTEGGAAAVWGGLGGDLIFGGQGADFFDGGPGNDRIEGGRGNDTIVGQRGDDALAGGDGDDMLRGGSGLDELEGGSGDDVLYGDEQNDILFGGDGADVLEGGGADDLLEGGEGRDRLLGQAGADELYGGPNRDFLIPGAGVDHADAGKGDDLVVILDACQVGEGEFLDGGEGHDTLLTPIPEHELAKIGVNVQNFETIRVFPAGGFDCDVATCDCGIYEVTPIVERDPCELPPEVYTVDEDLRVKAEVACREMIDQLPGAFDGLSANPTDAEAHAIVEQWQDPFDSLVGTMFGGVDFPHIPPFSPTVPMPGVLTSDEPCDMPQLDLHVGVARGGINNCSGGEEAEVEEALDRVRFMTFRMRQQIDAVVDAAADPTIAAALWTQSEADDPAWGRFALSHWFGEYDAGRALTVQNTVGEIEAILYADDDALLGPKHNVQCYHPLSWWQYVVFSGLNPLTVVAKTVSNPCWLSDETLGHAGFAVPVVGRVNAANAFYPFESVELCEAVFDDPIWGPPERLGGVILHELLHFHSNTEGTLRDNHGETSSEICDGPCYLEDNARALAVESPQTAIVNIDNYRIWATATHSLYTGGYCDDSDPGLCFSSECCGDGIVQHELSEVCDGDNLDGMTCLGVAGLTEGSLSCAADCGSPVTDACTGTCGNGAIDPFLEEECDESDLGGATCLSVAGGTGGSVSCSPVCTYDTSGCEGLPPASYASCGVPNDSPCLESPELCHQEADAGSCTGGPCVRTETDIPARFAGQADPSAPFHPRGNFRDVDGHLYRCEDGPDGPRTCVDDGGYGVCLECGLAEGQTMLGCPCTDTEQCEADMTCFGAGFPNGGFCWPNEGPPDFQCAEGGCGQTFGLPNAPDGSELPGGGSYCEHYPAFGGQARCMPDRCDNIAAQDCAGQGLVCDADGSACASECELDDDCTTGWPLAMDCSPALTCEVL